MPERVFGQNRSDAPFARIDKLDEFAFRKVLHLTLHTGEAFLRNGLVLSGQPGRPSLRGSTQRQERVALQEGHFRESLVFSRQVGPEPSH